LQINKVLAFEIESAAWHISAAPQTFWRMPKMISADCGVQKLRQPKLSRRRHLRKLRQEIKK